MRRITGALQISSLALVLCSAVRRWTAVAASTWAAVYIQDLFSTAIPGGLGTMAHRFFIADSRMALVRIQNHASAGHIGIRDRGIPDTLSTSDHLGTDHAEASAAISVARRIYLASQRG